MLKTREKTGAQKRYGRGKGCQKESGVAELTKIQRGGRSGEEEEIGGVRCYT